MQALPIFPLRQVSDKDLKDMCQILWSWEFCNTCESQDKCTTTLCASNRMGRLSTYFDYYKRISAAYENPSEGTYSAHLSSHRDLQRVSQLKLNSSSTNSQLKEILFSQECGSDVDRHCQDVVLDMAVRVAAMTSCSIAYPSSLSAFESRRGEMAWPESKRFHDFLSRGLVEPGRAVDPNSLKFRADLVQVRALNLVRHARLTFRGTDDVRRHMRLDFDEGVVEIFHHTAFLKEHLRATKLVDRDQGQVGVELLPRQICLEIIDSIQNVLYPLKERQSKELLKAHIAALHWDPDSLEYDSKTIRRPDEKDTIYLHYGNRLQDLLEEIRDPSPRSSLDKWLQRKSSAGHVMLATLIGVIFAVILGILALGLSAFQAWVAYEQWQHPVPSNE